MPDLLFLFFVINLLNKTDDTKIALKDGLLPTPLSVKSPRFTLTPTQ